MASDRFHLILAVCTFKLTFVKIAVHSMFRGTYQESKDDRAGTFAGWSDMLQRPQNSIAGNPVK